MKKLYAVLAGLLALLVLAVPVLANGNRDAMRVEYDGFGRVELNFLKDVSYRDALVSVVDADGRACEAAITEMDDDELEFAVKDIAPGEYGFTISGVRFGRMGEYETLTGSFKVPRKDEVVIQKVDYDADDRELELEFNARVQLDQPLVTLLDADGKEYEVKLREWDDEGVELRVEKLARGAEYTVTVHGVRPFGFDNTLSVSADFTAR